MKSVVLAVVALFAAVLVTTGPAEASARVTITVPTVARAGQLVRVAGTAPRGKVVRVQVARPGRWVSVRAVRARRGHWATTLRLTTTVRLRAVTGRRHSAYRTVRVTAPARTLAAASTTTKTTTTTSTAQPKPTDACGTQVLKANGTAWTCTLHEDFTGTTLDSTKWVPQTNFSTGSDAARACYRGDPSNVAVANGVLSLTLRKLSAPVTCTVGGKQITTDFVSGGVMSYHLFSQQYGRFEARIRNTATTSAGLHEAFWLWPDDRYPQSTIWPYAGEIDVSETYSVHPTLSIPFLHYSADVYGSLPGINTAWNCTASRGQWNTYTLEWTPTRLTILVNGKTCLSNPTTDSAFQKPYILALTQGLGAAGNEYVAGSTPVPATMQVDYVRVWK